jgi:hypothetical protein
MISPPSHVHLTSALQAGTASVLAGGGFYAAALQDEFRIHPPADGEVILLPPGTPLTCGPAENLSETVHAHLHGTFAQSDLRLGVAIMLGHHPDDGLDGVYAEQVRVEIDSWLGALTAFHFWCGHIAPPMSRMFGFFDGVAESWANRPHEGVLLN